MTETQIILIVVALAVIGVFFLRSKREESSLKRQLQNNALEEERVDVLMSGEDKDDFDDDDEDDGESERKEPSMSPKGNPLPQEEPPIYSELEKERNEAVEEAQREMNPAEAMGYEGIAEPVFDYGVQWVLDMSAIGTKGFNFGALDALNRDLTAISPSLPVELWVRAKKDGLYYPFKYCPNESSRVVVGITMANRAAAMNELTASQYLQVMEQLAAYSGTDVRPSMDMKSMLGNASQIAKFVKYYDSMFEILIVSKTDAPISTELLEKVAEESGFVKNSEGWGRWEYRFDPAEKEPVLVLANRGEPDGTVHFTFDIPNANLVRGDLKQFFQMANHLANHLNAAWVDCERHPIDAGGAMILQDEVTAKLEKMATAGVRGGSARARLIFSREA